METRLFHVETAWHRACRGIISGRPGVREPAMRKVTTCRSTWP